MATQAEKVVDSGKVPASLEKRADEVSEMCKAAHKFKANVPEDHIIHMKNSLHAYSYEIMDDGSVVALFANTADGKVKMLAFDDIGEASKWSPRDV